MTLSNGQVAAKDSRTNLLRAFKASGCVDCGKRWPELDWSELHIDHIDPRQKTSYLASQNSRLTVERILTELLKCRVLCTEHHRRRHAINGTCVIEQLSLFRGSGTWHYDNRNRGDR